MYVLTLDVMIGTHLRLLGAIISDDAYRRSWLAKDSTRGRLEACLGRLHHPLENVFPERRSPSNTYIHIYIYIDTCKYTCKYSYIYTYIYIYISGSVPFMSRKEYEEMAHLATSETRVTRA